MKSSHRIFLGTWDDKVEICKVTSVSGSETNPVYETNTPIVAWQRNTPDPNAQKYYNFTVLACQLNEPEDDVAPTDSRLV